MTGVLGVLSVDLNYLLTRTLHARVGRGGEIKPSGLRPTLR